LEVNVGSVALSGIYLVQVVPPNPGKSQIPLRYLHRTSFEPAANRLRSRQRNGVWPRTC